MSYIGKHIRKSTQGEHGALDAGQDALPNDEGIGHHAMSDDDADIRALLDDDTLDFDFGTGLGAGSDSEPDPDGIDGLDDPDDLGDIYLKSPFRKRRLRKVLNTLGMLLCVPAFIILLLAAFIGAKLLHLKKASELWKLLTTPAPAGIHGHRVDLDDLSIEKQLVIKEFTDEEVSIVLGMLLKQREDDNAQAHNPDAAQSSQANQPNQEARSAQSAPKAQSGVLQLDAATMAKAEAFRARKMKLDSREAHWLASVESLLRCKIQKPQGFDGLTAQQIYRKLYDFLTARFLPEAFIRSIVPELVYYVVNGELRRPLLLVGAPGCGKTTSIKIISEALGMVSCHFDAVTRDASHSLFGEASSFQDPDCGDLASGIISTGILNPIFHIDEPDKTSSPTTRAAFQDEALSLCDGSHETFTDTFLGFPLPLKGIIICFTSNTTDTITRPLLDRCEVIRFKDIEESRVQDIIANYAETERDSLLYKGALELDHAALRNAVAALYSRGVHSIRQHQKLVDRAFCDAFSAYVFNESDHPQSVVVGEALYAEAMASGEFVTAKKMGF